MGSFTNQVPCRDADPWLFEQYNISLAQPALNLCKECFFWDKCEALVEPKSSYFDGVCAGKVWRNGKILAKLSSASQNTLLVGVTLNEESTPLREPELFGD